MTLDEIRSEIYKAKGERESLLKREAKLKQRIGEIKEEKKKVRKAQEIIQIAAKATQEKLKYHITEATNLAFAAVFEDPYTLGLDFVVKRNKTEAEIALVRHEEKFDPQSAVGGGALDLAAMTLRFSIWSLKKTAPLLVFDEPLRFLSKDLQETAGMILREISSKLGVQVIMVTHSDELITFGDKIFRVYKNGLISKVEELRR